MAVGRVWESIPATQSRSYQQLGALLLGCLVAVGNVRVECVNSAEGTSLPLAKSTLCMLTFKMFRGCHSLGRLGGLDVKWWIYVGVD